MELNAARAWERWRRNAGVGASGSGVSGEEMSGYLVSLIVTERGVSEISAVFVGWVVSVVLLREEILAGGSFKV